MFVSILLLTTLWALMIPGALGAGGEPYTVPETLRLWQGAAPGALGNTPEDIPTITIYRPSADKSNGASIVICPGGGYGSLAPHEAAPPAEWLTSLGVTGIVLTYRIAPHYHHPVMMQDVERAIRLVRSHAAEWKLDSHRIGIMGFSAGGHLASTAATHFDEGNVSSPDPIERLSSRPDAAILIYPVITMTLPHTHEGTRQNLLQASPSEKLVDLMSNEKQVTSKTPPTFLVHTNDDAVVPAENSLLFALACKEHKVPVELHIFLHGPHGFGMGGSDPILKTWPDLCSKWLRSIEFLKSRPRD